MITQSMLEKVKQHLQSIKNPVAIEASLDETAASNQLKQLLQALQSSSDKIRLSFDGSDIRKPSFSIRQDAMAGENALEQALSFAAIPLGHEFSSLVLALLWAGAHPPKVAESQLAQIKSLKGSFRFEVYMSLSCHNCPDVVQALSLMALINPAVKTVVIDGALFQGEVDERKIMAVPSIYLNGEFFGSGRMGLSEILAKLDQSLPAEQAIGLSKREAYDLLVIGGGPAGVSAAIYAARKGIRTGLVADRLGGQLNDTMAIENFISLPLTDGPKLSSALEHHLKTYDIDLITMQRVKKLRPTDKGEGLVQIDLESGAQLEARSLVISTGARWRQLGIPGEERYRNKGVAYCPHCDGPLYKGKRVAVVGGGNSGVEAAIDLAGLASQVTLLEFAPNLKADAVLIEKLSSLHNVEVVTGAMTRAIEGDDGVVSALTYIDQRDGTEHRLALEGVFVQIGLVPNTEWLKGTLELNAQGEIIVDAKGQTSLKGVFAAGDVTTTPFKQIIIAAGDGAKAALGAFDDLIRRMPQHGDSSFANKNIQGTNEASKPRDDALELRKAA
ncbi:MAG: alkyl hydroperoxide reductase subunit F [Betaproteobacteria bacterium]|jgi:alkyl hydroperoxide reductase subunit F|nr:alkyl hydroperoxide reductase subunit F [Burkholderiaceae bacterium]NBS81880.1 alkyl hydroperoxide reductase subunit F [Betaproteobacteria bacterium]NBT99247.1 alkyl hydroperoxide reductase subunit F [Betaproteobacteria bacterium]NCX02842.1 alkyl hydroperoxide reductase subunit F [Betaproteobacteria bacterium]NDE32292.1 alkyl hydroperoxide reductase subunit F [Betaproteobacteria bacterium]